MTLKELFRLYGIAALFSSVRKLHLEVQETKAQLQIVQQRADERVDKAERLLDSRSERLLTSKGVTPIPAAQTATVAQKRASSPFRERIRKAQEQEANYHRLSGKEPVLTPGRLAEEREFDADALLSNARAIVQQSASGSVGTQG
jgi:hypothetical protein